MNLKTMIRPVPLIFLILLLGVTRFAFSMERFDIVTTQELKSLIDERDSGRTDFLLVNGLDQILYRDSSIPGSVNIPWSDIEGNRQKLGPDKDRLIVTY